MNDRFRVARNPNPESKLPHLVQLPVDGGVVLKARETWPRAARVFASRTARLGMRARVSIGDNSAALTGPDVVGQSTIGRPQV